MRTHIAIIGDRFMLPSVFETAIRRKCGDGLTVRSHEMPWPDLPMQHGYDEVGMDGLKEYQGTADEVVLQVGDASIVVTQLAPFSAGIMDRLPALRMIAVSRGGPVNIDTAAAHRRHILVVNTPGRNASAVAEFTMGVILAETRHITRGHEALRRGEWRGDLYRAELAGEELCEMTVGVVGYGHVGTRVVRILRAFGCKVLVSDPYVQLLVDDIKGGVEQVSLERILTESDIVTLHARVTEETLGFIGAEQFSAMKKGAYFINTARGPLVDYSALTQALKSRHLRGAAIETFSVEPVPEDWELLHLDNVTLTPHIAGASVKTVRFAAEAVAEEVRRFLAGERPLNPC